MLRKLPHFRKKAISVSLILENFTFMSGYIMGVQEVVERAFQLDLSM